MKKIYYRHLRGNPMIFGDGLVERGETIEVQPAFALGVSRLAKDGNGEILLDDEITCVNVKPYPPPAPIRMVDEERFRKDTQKRLIEEFFAPKVQEAVDAEIARLHSEAAKREKLARGVLI